MLRRNNVVDFRAGGSPNYRSQRRRLRSRKQRATSGWFAFVLFVGLSGFAFIPGVEKVATALPVGLDPPTEGSEFLEGSFPQCRGGNRNNCTVDGDTFYFKGEKFRLAGIDAPELYSPACKREKRLAESASEKLAKLLSSRKWQISREGFDRYGRTLATFFSEGTSLGRVLISTGFARSWKGQKERWCT